MQCNDSSGRCMGKSTARPGEIATSPNCLWDDNNVCCFEGCISFYDGASHDAYVATINGMEGELKVHGVCAC